MGNRADDARSQHRARLPARPEMNQTRSPEAPRQSALDCSSRALGPIVSMLLDCGVGCRDAMRMLRWVFVQEASAKLSGQGRKHSISRIAAMTGIPRAEVRALLTERAASAPPSEQTTGSQKSSRVLTGWLTDADFLAADGNPLPLPYAGAIPSFSELARRYAGDTPPRAVLDELTEARAVERCGDDEYVPVKRESYRISPDAKRLSDVGEALRIAATGATQFVRDTDGGAPNFHVVVSEELSKLSYTKAKRELDRRAGAFALAAQQYLMDQSRMVSTTKLEDRGRGRLALLVSITAEEIKDPS